MELYCFDQNKDFRDRKRFICLTEKDRKRPTLVTQMPGVGDVADWIHKPRDTQEMPDWAKEERGRVELRTKAETEKKLKESPRPVPPGARENLRRRTIEEIFETRECQEWYINKVREALENPAIGDKLHAFIHRNKGYRNNSYQAWNRDFAEVINLTDIPEAYRGAGKTVTYRRITAAAQHVLVDYYQNDVFQISLEREKSNPWIYIDGLMGPYSVSALNDYWMTRHSKGSKMKPIPPGRSNLNKKSYSPDGENWALFLDALNYLSVQTGKAPRGAEPPQRNIPPEREMRQRVSGKRLDEIIQVKYTRLDQGGDIPARQFKIEGWTCRRNNTFLSAALAVNYREQAKPKNSKSSPRTFRVLNLVARKVGAKIDDMKLQEGDVLTITEQGELTITKSDGKPRYPKIQLG
ncbi:hypothetical protein JXD20_02045 [Candidatus Peregrinibacteria bacterium]|nr:hypothetical protein [Candidatus Peregrinibacteria bacterium]